MKTFVKFSLIASKVTVLQIRFNPKKNAPGISKQPAVVNRHFKLNPKIFSKTDDIRPSN